jgi:hypothetical protein
MMIASRSKKHKVIALEVAAIAGAIGIVSTWA